MKVTIGKSSKMIEFQITEGVIPKLIGGINLLNAFNIHLQEDILLNDISRERDICSNEVLTIHSDIQT